VRRALVIALAVYGVAALAACQEPTRPTHTVCTDTLYYRFYPPEVSDKLAMYLFNCREVPL
jgi:hypothetical protein